MTAALALPSPVRFRGRSLMALVLRPETPIGDWLAGLDVLLDRSPGYFTSRPVVADVSALAENSNGLVGLMEQFQARNIRIMAIEGTDPASLGEWAVKLPPLVNDGRPAKELSIEMPAPPVAANEDSAEPRSAVAAARAIPSLIIEKPVRSGQSISFAEGDITILGSVASGAEIVAGGSIHVYGALRGRAMAGFAHKNGRIFCSRLHAELLAIDGIYKTADEMDGQLRGRAIQAWSKDDALVIAGLA